EHDNVAPSRERSEHGRITEIEVRSHVGWTIGPVRGAATDNKYILRSDLSGPHNDAFFEIERQDSVACGLLRLGIHVAGRDVDQPPFCIDCWRGPHRRA